MGHRKLEFGQSWWRGWGQWGVGVGWTQESRASRLWGLFGSQGSHRRIRLCFKMMILDPSEVTVEWEPDPVVGTKEDCGVWGGDLVGGSGGAWQPLCAGAEQGSGAVWRKNCRRAGHPSKASLLDMPSAGWEILAKLPAFSVPAFLHQHQVTVRRLPGCGD